MAQICSCYQDIEPKFTRAAFNYSISHPNTGYRKVREEIKNNFSPEPKACGTFHYSGTIWCDDCGHEQECHPTIILPCVGCQAKIPVISGITPRCDDCKDEG